MASGPMIGAPAVVMPVLSAPAGPVPAPAAPTVPMPVLVPGGDAVVR
jgi:hypothetical protein